MRIFVRSCLVVECCFRLACFRCVTCVLTFEEEGEEK